MQNKKLIIAVVAIAVVAAIGLVFMARPKGGKPAVPAKVAKAGKAAPMAAVPAKRALSKDMGGLTVKLLGAGNREVPVRIRAFKAVDSSSSVLTGTFASNRMQELVPGTYDIEVETNPAKIYKGVSVQKGREAVKDLGRPTGGLEIRALNSAKKPAAYPVRVLQANTAAQITTGSTNRPMEIVAGVYDVEIASIPRQVKKGVRVDAGKDVSVDTGAVGTLLVRTIEPAGKEIRGSARVRRSDNNETITSTASNKPLDILPGSYVVECLSTPPQTKKDINVKAGEETKVDFVVQPPPAPAPAKKPGA